MKMPLPVEAFNNRNKRPYAYHSAAARFAVGAVSFAVVGEGAVFFSGKRGETFLRPHKLGASFYAKGRAKNTAPVDKKFSGTKF